MDVVSGNGEAKARVGGNSVVVVRVGVSSIDQTCDDLAPDLHPVVRPGVLRARPVPGVGVSRARHANPDVWGGGHRPGPVDLAHRSVAQTIHDNRAEGLLVTRWRV